MIRRPPRSTPKIACSTTPPRASTVAATRSIASRAGSRPLTLTFAISQLLGPRNWAMVGGSNGYRAALVRRQLTPGLISSLPATAGLPPFICFSTSYPLRDHANLPRALTHPTLAYRESRGSARRASTLPRGLRRFNVLGEIACLFGIATPLPAWLGVFRA